MKSEFVSMVSHELRTPLTSIRGALGLLAGGAFGPLAPGATRMVDIAMDSSERLARLINDILDLERIESGGLPIKVGTHHAADLIDAAVTQVQVQAAEAGVRLRVGRAGGWVRADPDHVVQTMLNLLSNAIKFSPRHATVEIEALEAGGVIEFQITDHGRGIPQEKLDVIFARFEQVDTSDARAKGGFGLGLAISRSLVERQGGRIWAENNPTGGAVFRFTLPACAPGADRGLAEQFDTSSGRPEGESHLGERQPAGSASAG